MTARALWRGRGVGRGVATGKADCAKIRQYPWPDWRFKNASPRYGARYPADVFRRKA